MENRSDISLPAFRFGATLEHGAFFHHYSGVPQ